jgi:hypothetical protein
MAGWATLWLGGLTTLAVLLTPPGACLDPHPVARRPSGRAAARTAGGLEWRRLTSHWSRMVRALNDGVLSLKDRDFSMSVTGTTHDETR